MSDLNRPRVLRPNVSQLASHQDMDLFTNSIAAFASPSIGANEPMNVAVLYMAFARGLEQAGVLDASSMPKVTFCFRAVLYTVSLSSLGLEENCDIRNGKSTAPNADNTQMLASQPAASAQTKGRKAAEFVARVSKALQQASDIATKERAATPLGQGDPSAHTADAGVNDSRVACDQVLVALRKVQTSEVAIEAAFVNTNRAYHQLGVLYVTFAKCLLENDAADIRVESTAFHRSAFPRLLEKIKQTLADAPLVTTSGNVGLQNTQSRFEDALGISFSALRKRLERARKFFCLVEIFDTTDVLHMRPVISVVNVDKLSFQLLAEARGLAAHNHNERAHVEGSAATCERMDVDI